MPSSAPGPHIDAAKQRLAHLAGLASRTADAEQRILDAAERRLTAIAPDLAALRPRVNTDEAAADRYQALVLEQGQLTRVAAQAREVLDAKA